MLSYRTNIVRLKGVLQRPRLGRRRGSEEKKDLWRKVEGDLLDLTIDWDRNTLDNREVVE